MKKYVISTPSYDFVATITKDLVYKETNYFMFGGKRECVTIIIHKNDPIAILQSVTKGAECAYNKPLPEKEGTRAMIAIAFATCIRLFPHVHTISIEDEAMTDCDNGVPMYLADMYVVQYGTTYYGKYFGATPDSKDIKRKLRHLHADFVATSKSLPFSHLWNMIRSKLPPLQPAEYAKIHQEYKKVYDSATSLFDMFQKLNQSGCGTINRWIPTMLRKVYGLNLHGSLWSITRNTIESYETRHTILSTKRVSSLPYLPKEPSATLRIDGGNQLID